MNSLITTDVAEAAARLAAGGLVGMPTETVYGLAADATNRLAVERLYEVKGRPSNHPVIVHVASAECVEEWTTRLPAWAAALGEAFWPGPLTLVLPKAPWVGEYLTGGQDTVGLRVPGHRLTLELLRQFGQGVAAPSANRFGRVSPTSAQDVSADLGARLDQERDAILDGGVATVGIESTIVDATGEAPRILRTGAVSAASVRQVAGVAVAEPSTAGPTAARAPGMLPVHYAPDARVVVVESEQFAAEIATLDGSQVGVLALAELDMAEMDVADQVVSVAAHRLAAPRDAEEFAATLYAALRKADELGLSTVLVVPPPDVGIGIAIRDRLARASRRPEP